eukprot:TRINITY_DN3843_c0_g1_i2.p1 TRINITY_DN3843_c0_g1~~TRINITY_DN3843_c0_g1_i2.p1  ORF type:complete len:308 (+),score=70.43 TRINITY_DN3843_c0_g1_i2:825-1748(+)
MGEVVLKTRCAVNQFCAALIAKHTAAGCRLLNKVKYIRPSSGSTHIVYEVVEHEGNAGQSASVNSTLVKANQSTDSPPPQSRVAEAIGGRVGLHPDVDLRPQKSGMTHVVYQVLNSAGDIVHVGVTQNINTRHLRRHGILTAGRTARVVQEVMLKTQRAVNQFHAALIANQDALNTHRQHPAEVPAHSSGKPGCSRVYVGVAKDLSLLHRYLTRRGVLQEGRCLRVVRGVRLGGRAELDALRKQLVAEGVRDGQQLLNVCGHNLVGSAPRQLRVWAADNEKARRAFESGNATSSPQAGRCVSCVRWC